MNTAVNPPPVKRPPTPADADADMVRRFPHDPDLVGKLPVRLPTNRKPGGTVTDPRRIQ